MPQPIRPLRPHQRSWHEGTVREVRPGVWRAERPRVKDAATGRSSRPSRTFNGDGAEQRATAWARGDPEPTVVVLGDFLNRWLARVRPTISPNTYDSYRRHVLACKPLAGRPLAGLTPEDWQTLTNTLLTRWSRYHVAVWKGNVSVALRTAVPRHLASNPLAGVKLPKRQEEPPKAWTQAEVDRLLAVSAGKAHEPWLLFSLGTGVRLGEARALLWRDVDLAARTATIRASLDNNTSERGPTKTRKLRVIDLPDEVCDALAELVKRQQPGQALVFGYLPKRGKERAYRPRSYRSWLKTRCTEAGITPLPPHSLRHTCASLALARRVPVADVARQLGHSVETCTRTYSHYVNEGLRVMAGAMSGALTHRFSGAPLAIGARDGAR